MVDITVNPYANAAKLNSSSRGQSVFVINSVAYVTTQDGKLLTFALSGLSTSSPPTITTLGSISLTGVGIRVVVIGNYAYVAESGYKQLEIVQVQNNGATLSIVKSIALTAQDAVDMAMNSTGTRSYVATAYNSAQNEFFIVNTDSTSAQYGQVISGYSTSGMSPIGITAQPGNVVVLGGSGGETYQVINIANESSPILCGGLTLSYSIYSLSSVLEPDGDAFTYLLTSDSSGGEFKMIEGGPGGTYASSGIFESQTFNPGYQTANNSFYANYSQPSGTTIKFQVSMANLISGICPSTGSYTYVGPDGTSSTYFTPTSGQVMPFPVTTNGSYANPGQCMRYKVYFTTTVTTSTPVLYDFTINYSP